MDFTYLFIVLVVVFGSMVLHELMHGLTAYWLGDNTAKEHGRLTLNPIKHIDPFMTLLLPLLLAIAGMPIFGGAKPVPFRPDRVKGGEWGAALVGIAGPITNFILAFMFFVAAWALGKVIVIDGNILFAGDLIANFLISGVMINLGFFAFNILPIPPLDGSRVLYAVAPTSVQRVLEVLEGIGIWVVLAVVLLANNLLGNVLSLIINSILDLFVMLLPI